MASLLDGALRLLGRKASPDPAPQVADTSFVALDLEMTGLDPARDGIVAMGAVRLRGGRILLGESFEALVRPAAAMGPESVRIHRITPAEVADLPGAGQAMERLRRFVGQAVPVGWCLDIDLAFLAAEAARLGMDWPATPGVDVAALYQSLLRLEPGRLPEVPCRELNLYTLAQALDIEVAETHQALGDAWLAARVFQRLLALRPMSLARLAVLGRQETPLARHFSLG